MKKSLLSLKLACLGAMTMMFISCGGADYRNILPADSFMVVSVDNASLTKKCDAGPIEQNPLFAKLQQELAKDQSITPEQREYILNLLKNPGESGIDQNKDIYLFSSLSDAANPEIAKAGLLIPLADKAKLEAMIAQFDQEESIKFQKEGDLSYVNISSNDDSAIVFAYNDIALLVFFSQVFADDPITIIKQLFAQDARNSIMGDKDTAAQISAKNDINFVVLYAGFSSFLQNPMLNALPAMAALKDVVIVGSVNFEKGQIVTDGSVKIKDAASKQKLQEFYAYIQPQKAALLNYVPKNVIGAIGYGINGGQLFSILAALPGYGMMMSNPIAKQAIEAIDGDLLISFAGMDEARMPIASALVQVKDAAILQTLLSNIPNLPIEKVAENEYKYELSGATVLLGVKNGILYCTTNAIVKSALDGASIESLNTKSNIFKGQSGSFYFDFVGLNSLISQYLSGDVNPQIEAALAFLSLFDNMEAYGTMDNSKIIVNMADKDQNSLKTIYNEVIKLINANI